MVILRVDRKRKKILEILMNITEMLSNNRMSAPVKNLRKSLIVFSSHAFVNFFKLSKVVVWSALLGAAEKSLVSFIVSLYIACSKLQQSHWGELCINS